MTIVKLRIEESEFYPWFMETPFGEPTDFELEVTEDFYDRFCQMLENVEEIHAEIMRMRRVQLEGCLS